ncbi:IclR family transcriptional regulator [Roseateles sp. BYS180W]|uniref:IclR family transcriptional regulator n=1 Tax=Roseateles rivi TaxID=3299028 RepID=A0ABW7FWK6_9BURK
MPRKATSEQNSDNARDNKYAAPALEKGLDILEALADEAVGLTQSELAQRLGRSTSEIFRMVQTLQRRGWVMVMPGDRYRLSLHMFELSHRQRPLRSLVEAALPLMQDVSRRLLQSCHLSVAESGRLMVVAQTDSPGMLCFAVRTGAVLGLLNTSSGHVLLAFASDAERERIIDAHIMLSGGLIKRPAGLDDVLDEVRRQGYAQERSEQVFGVTNLAFPVFDRSGLPVASMVIPFLEGLGGPDRETQIQEALGLLGQTAAALSRRLGYVAAEAELQA